MSQLLSLLKEGELAQSGILPHLAELIRGSVENKSELKGLSNIQIFSYYLRRNKFNFKEFLGDEKLKTLVGKDKQYATYVSAVEELQRRLNSSNDHRPYQRSDIVQEYHALKIAGVSIGETNAHHLNKVIKALAVEYQVKSIRFWGKILGYKDYYVIQGASSKQYLSQLPENGEKYGVGVNSYSYWVSTDILGHWSELPLVTPQQISGSRTFKYVFTGDLQREISHSIAFVGKQKHLLKSILARITHSCQLTPKGLYKVNEENPSIIDYEEEFKLPEVAQMNGLDGWAHLNPNILHQGRCSYYLDPKLTPQAQEALSAEWTEKDPIIERLKGISQDKPFETLGFAANWTNAISGETVPVNQIGKQQGQSVIYGVAVLRNLVWPGAVTVGYRGGWVNIYVGYGHRLSQQYTAIRELKQLQIQGQDRVERPEPTPSKAPVVQQKKQDIPPPPVDE